MIESLQIPVNSFEIIIPMIFIILDVISGVLKAFFQKTLSSLKMREGLMHKAAYILVIILAVLLQVSSVVFNFGFEIPSVLAVAIYICCAEVVSIIENIGEMNPQLSNSSLFKLFDKFYKG